MTNLSRWAEVYRRFDPEEPATNPAWHADRAYNTVNEIDEGLNLPFGDKRYLLLGTVGTGKSTELYRVASQRAKNGPVVLLDIAKHFAHAVKDANALQHVQPWETLLLAGLAIYAAGQKRFFMQWSREITDQFREATAALSATESVGYRVDIGKLAGAVFAVVGGPVAGAIGASAGKALEIGAGAITELAGVAEDWTLPIGLPRQDKLRDQDLRVHALLLAVNALILELNQKLGNPTLVIDGLDRITELNTARQLFIESALLASLPCATVVAGPRMLQRRKLAAQIRRFEPKILANLPVIDREKPKEPGPGCGFFIELFRRRVAELGPAFIPDEQLRTLAYYSGGRSRDFVRLVRTVAEICAGNAIEVASAAEVEVAIDRRRRIIETGLNKRDLEILTSVANDPLHVLPDDEEVDLLLDQWCLLPYPNESEWYFPHPLLTIHRVKVGELVSTTCSR